jgi:hypothetical protein
MINGRERKMQTRSGRLTIIDVKASETMKGRSERERETE